MRAPKQTKESWNSWYNFARSLIMVFATTDMGKDPGLKAVMYKLNSWHFTTILDNLVSRAKDPNGAITLIKNLPGLQYFDTMLQAAGLLNEEEIKDVEEGLVGLKAAKQDLARVSREIRREWDEKPIDEKAEIITAQVTGKVYNVGVVGKGIGMGILRGIQKGLGIHSDNETLKETNKETMGQ
jgi:hypothetical protein